MTRRIIAFAGVTFAAAAAFVPSCALAQDGTKDVVPPTLLHGVLKGEAPAPAAPAQAQPAAVSTDTAGQEAPAPAAPAHRPRCPTGRGGPTPRARKRRPLRLRRNRPRCPTGRGAPAQAQPAAVPTDTAGQEAPAAPVRPGREIMAGGLEGCPRAVLRSLITPGEQPGGAYEALGVELEALRLCRERQSIVLDILKLEEELREAAGAAVAAAVIPAGAAPSDSAAPKGSDVLVSLGDKKPVAGAARDAAGARLAEALGETDILNEESPVALSGRLTWFSIVGAAGKLQAGVSDGVRTWWTEVGDTPSGADDPSAVEWRVVAISSRPPGVVILRDGERVSIPHSKPLAPGGYRP